MIHVGLSITERIALSVIRGLLNGTVSKFTPTELQNYIDSDQSLWGDTPEGMKHIIREVKNRFYTHYKKYFGQINTEMLVDWLKKDQPGLHAVITTNSKNYQWYDHQVQMFKKQIEEI